MNSRLKLGISILTFALILAVMSFGIYAAVMGSYSIKNTIGYQTSPGVLANFSGKITGASKTPGQFKATAAEIDDINLTGFDTRVPNSSSEEEIGDLYFVENADGTAVYEITFIIKVQNVGTAEADNKTFKLSVSLASEMINNTENIEYKVEYASTEDGQRTELAFNTSGEVNKTVESPSVGFDESMYIFISYNLTTLVPTDNINNQITITAK